MQEWPLCYLLPLLQHCSPLSLITFVVKNYLLPPKLIVLSSIVTRCDVAKAATLQSFAPPQAVVAVRFLRLSKFAAFKGLK